MQPDAINNRTYVAWSDGLGDEATGSVPTSKHPKFFALRQRAALFGYNAVFPLMFAGTTAFTALQTPPIGPSLLNGNDWDFTGPNVGTGLVVDLDAVYPKLTPGGWLVLIDPDKNNSRSPAGRVSLYQANSVTTVSRSAYAISAKISRVAVDTNASVSALNLYYTNTRETSADFVQSDRPRP